MSTCIFNRLYSNEISCCAKLTCVLLRHRWGRQKGDILLEWLVFYFFWSWFMDFSMLFFKQLYPSLFCLEMFSHGKVAVTVNSWIILQRPLRAAELQPGLTEKLRESRTSYKSDWEYLYAVNRESRKVCFFQALGWREMKKVKFLDITDSSMLLISKRYLRECKTYTC